MKKLEKNNLNKVASKLDDYLGKDNRLGDILFGLQKIYQQGKAGDEKAKAIIEKLNTLDKGVDILADISDKVAKEYDKLDKKIFKAHVDNFPEVIKSEITNFPKQKELQKVEMERPAWYKQFDLNGLMSSLSELLSRILQVKVTNTNPSEAIPVRLTDGFKFYSAIISAVSSAYSEINLKNANGAVINPSTTEKQDEMIEAIDNISIDTSTLATAAKQLPDNHQVTVSNFPETENPSLSITSATEGDVTTTTFVKTIGETSYTKTIAKNNVTGAVTISAWS